MEKSEQNMTDIVRAVNGVGVINRDFSIDAPFVIDPITLQPIDINTDVQPTILNYKGLSNLDNDKKIRIERQIQKFIMSHLIVIEHQRTYLKPSLLTYDNCDNPALQGQYGIFACQDIPALSFLGFYSGLYITSDDILDYVFMQYNDLHIARYGQRCQQEGYPVICGHYGGNYMSVINDWRPFKWYEYEENYLEEVKQEHHNSETIIVQVDDIFLIAYIAKKDIPAGVELITDYGQGYWEREEQIIHQALSMP